MVPVFAYGPGAEEFVGIMENTDIPQKMKKLFLPK
jgi:alkaline phosphatase